LAKGDIPCRYLLSYSPGGSKRRDVGPGVHMGPPFSRREVMGSAMVPFERAMVVSYRLSIVTIALPLIIWPQFAIECLQRSNQQRVDQFGAKVGEEGADRSRETRGCRMQKKCVDIFCRLSTMQKRVRQADKQIINTQRDRHR